MMWDDSWSTGQWTAMMVMMLLVVAVGVALVVWLVRELGSSTTPEGTRREEARTPEQILAERFARGEIDEDEFARRKSLLSEHRT